VDMDSDLYLDRYLILETLPAGVSQQKKSIQQSKARSHASTIGRQRAIFERNALNNVLNSPGPRIKPRRNRAGVYRVGPSPHHVRRHVVSEMPGGSFQSNTGPVPPRVENTQYLPEPMSAIPGSPYSENTKQKTTKQTPSSEVSSMPSFQLIQYNPLKTTPETTHAVRSNAVRYQWKRSKAVRASGRKTKVPEDQGVDSNIRVARTTLRSQGGSNQTKELVKLPRPGQDNSLQPGGYPTELPTETLGPLYHLGRYSLFLA